RAQLLAALAAPAPARIVRVAATIDMSEGRAFIDSADQARRSIVKLPSNTTLLGVTAGAGFINGSLSINGVSQVVVRNLALRNPCDVGPVWDPKDGPKGNWNSLFDAITVSASRHIWIDHNSFTDAPITDDTLPEENGMLKQCHDGALDINQASDFVSVTYNRFSLHQKNTLVGSGDRATGDDGHLRVTFKANLFEHVSERAPRVRFGQVHLLNNYHVGDRKHPAYHYGYSVGVGKQSHIVGDANAYDIAGVGTCAQVVRDPGSSPGTFQDTGSLLNGRPLKDCPYGGDVGWKVPYAYAALPAQQVREHVLANAGPRALAMDAGGEYAQARFIPAAGTPFILKARGAGGDWQGASVQLAGGDVQVELLEARAGKVERLKQVRRRAPLAGAPVALRVDADGGQMVLYLDGERVTSAAVTALPVSVSTEAGRHTLLDLQQGSALTPPARVTVRMAGNTLALQAGDPAQRLLVASTGGKVRAEVADMRIASAAIDGDVLAVTPLSAGRTVVTVVDASGAQTAFAVQVGPAFVEPRATVKAVSPRTGERGVPPDTPLRMTFDQPPVLTGLGSVRILRRSDRALVAVVYPGETLATLGPLPRQRIVRQQAIKVDGKQLTIALPQQLAYGAEYEVAVEAALAQGTVAGKPFAGARWHFQTTPFRPVGDSVTVDGASRADFRTVQGALDYAMSLPRAKAVTVNLHAGVFDGPLYLHSKDNVTIRGASPETSIVRTANSDARNPGSGAGQEAGMVGMTGGRALLLAEDCDLLELRDLTMHNTTRRSDGHSAQAETLFFNHDSGRFMA
ncbi:MAG TPA: Ig-like domain-containing protein, partial [Burkholderiaceae bacterium]